MSDLPPADPTSCPPIPVPENSKAVLECEKLRLEIENLRTPFRKNPAHWISSATALLAITALFFQYRLSKSESLLAEAKSVQAKNEMTKAENMSKDLKDENQQLEKDIASKVAQKNQLENLLRSADALLGKAQTNAEPTLRGEIETLRETTKPSSQFWSSLPSFVNQPSFKDAARISQTLRDANNELTQVRNVIMNSELSGFQFGQTGFNQDTKNQQLENQLASIKPGYQQPVGYTKYKIRITADRLEFLFFDAGKDNVFYSTDANKPSYGKDFEDAVKRSMEPQLKAELSRSD